ncbi:MAG: hypothetical protein IPN24_06145 [Betaproteobacteria bacterium]|nr:hypothetical protein [Betaproteobacteria bacterium]
MQNTKMATNAARDPHPAIPQRPGADAVRRMQHRQRDGRQGPKKTPATAGTSPETQVDHERDQDEQRRQHEQPAGDDTAQLRCSNQPIAGGELLRLRGRAAPYSISSTRAGNAVR